jgi:cytosine/adenosine deaminase-related metal-dependent hydrolase
MILENVKLIGADGPVNIRIDDGKITGILSSDFSGINDTLHLKFDNAIAFPGLINSHDHLDFNLFPQLGNRFYNNYTEWGKCIHEHYKDEIARILAIPVALRSRWGVFKNLLCGVTTVVNHGEPSGMDSDLITVFEKHQCIHSVQFEKRWRFKLNNPFKTGLPVVIHVGEGDDWLSFNEINQLISWNLLNKKLIGVHGVIMSDNQAANFEALIWCPQSNYFLLNKTAPVNLLIEDTSILFGTDSTLTGSWDMLEHLRTARSTGLLSDEALFKTFSQNAAETWGLNSGSLAPGKNADLVVAKAKNNHPDFDTFYDLTPADLLLVVHEGNIRLFDETLSGQLNADDLVNFSKVYINGAGKYVQGDLPALIKKIKEYDPTAVFPVSAN